jgi:hypothetical protein
MWPGRQRLFIANIELGYFAALAGKNIQHLLM